MFGHFQLSFVLCIFFVLDSPGEFRGCPALLFVGHSFEHRFFVLVCLFLGTNPGRGEYHGGGWKLQARHCPRRSLVLCMLGARRFCVVFTFCGV